jgi:hypothetical protein
MLLPSGERQGGKVGKSAIVPRLCALRDQVSLFRGGGLVLRRSSALRSPELGRSQRKEQGTGGLEDTDYKARKAQRRAKVSQIEQDTPFFVVKLGERFAHFPLLIPLESARALLRRSQAYRAPTAYAASSSYPIDLSRSEDAGSNRPRPISRNGSIGEHQLPAFAGPNLLL